MKINGYLVFFILLSAFISFYKIDKNALDGDEVVTANAITGFGFIHYTPFDGLRKYPAPSTSFFTPQEYWKRNTVENAIKYTIDDCGHSFTYNIFMHYWINRVGFSIANLRNPSAFCIVLATLLFYFFVRKTFKEKRPANIATLLFVLHALVIQVAHFARMYALALALLMGIVILSKNLEDAFREKRSRHIIINGFFLGILVALALITHYFVALALTGIVVYFLVRAKEFGWLQLLKALVSIAIPFIILMWVYLFRFDAIRSIVYIVQLNKMAADGSVQFFAIEPVTLKSAIWSFLCRLTTSFGNSTSSTWDVKSWLNVFLFIFPLLVMLLNFKAAIRKYGKNNVYFLLYGFVGYVITTLAVVAVTKNIVIMHARYWIFCLPFSLALLAVCFTASADQENKKIRLATILCFSVVMLRMLYTIGAYVNDLHYTIGESGAVVNDAEWQGDRRAHLAQDIINEYKAGDTVSYNNRMICQQENWFFKDHPQVIQQIDTMQKAEILIFSKKNIRIIAP